MIKGAKTVRALRLLLCLFASTCARPVAAEPLVTIQLTPPEAQFSVRHSKGTKIPGGPDPQALLPSGSQIEAGLVDGERGIIVTVRQAGYADFEQKYTLAPHKENWADLNQGWIIPIELNPSGLVGHLRHEIRFHPAPLVAALLALSAGLGMAGCMLRARTIRAGQSAGQKEDNAQAAVSESEQFRKDVEFDLVGDRIGSYRVLRKLGEGGFAQVYLLENLKAERFAMKILKKGQFTPSMAERIQREAEVGRGLNHPNLAAVKEFGNHLGSPFLIMDYVQGKQLGAFLEDRPADLGERLVLFEQICQGVAYAHAKGIMHRDLKPQNILITPEGMVKVLDFGMAKPIEDQRKLTRTGDVFGTPSYMSPEQLMGWADQRADVYALGIILYELVTGRLPFVAKDAMDIMTAHLCHPVPPISSLVNVDLALERLCEGMLQKDPSSRIQSVEDVLIRLETLRPRPLATG